MSDKSISVAVEDSDFEVVVVIRNITYVKKSECHKYANIHLIDGTILQSTEQIRVIEARINCA